jgi:hypothetical protein
MPVCTSCSAELKPEWKFCIHCGAPAVPGAIRPDDAAPAPVNIIAIFSFVLACIASPLAALFGHVALRQLRTSGERGISLARIATVLGYVWLVIVVLVVAWVLIGARR